MTKNIVFSHFSSLDGKGISARWWRAKKRCLFSTPINYSARPLLRIQEMASSCLPLKTIWRGKNSTCPVIWIIIPDILIRNPVERQTSYRFWTEWYALQLRRITPNFGWLYAIDVAHSQFLGHSRKMVPRLESVEKWICAINTQDNTWFWVDIRYKRSAYPIFRSFLENGSSVRVRWEVDMRNKYAG